MVAAKTSVDAPTDRKTHHHNGTQQPCLTGNPDSPRTVAVKGVIELKRLREVPAEEPAGCHGDSGGPGRSKD